MGDDPERGLDALLEVGRARGDLPRGPRDGRLRRRRVAPQGRLEAHEAGRASGRAAPRGALGRALPRHRQDQDALHLARRRGALPRPRRGRRAHVRQARAAPRPLRARAGAQGDGALPGPASPAREPVRARLDRQRRAPLRARDRRRTSTTSCASRAPTSRPSAPRRSAAACSRSRSCRSASASSPRKTRCSRRCRAASATRS